MRHFKTLVTLGLSFLLASCAPPAAQMEEQQCRGDRCTEAEINAPVPGSTESAPTNGDMVGPAMRMPPFQPAWGVQQDMYEKVARYYDDHYNEIRNRRYVTIIDFSRHSSEKRFFLFDLLDGTVNRYNTSHGKNSDRNKDGYATDFSNVVNSKKTSLGFYFTLGTYQGGHGHSMRLQGLERSNSNAYKRAIVVHPAAYVREADNYAGLSWGCPALDHAVSKEIIEKIKDGSLFYIGR